MKKYIAVAGTVRSRTDGQTHYVPAHMVATAYGVLPIECILLSASEEQNSGYYGLSRYNNLPVLKVQPSGKYDLAQVMINHVLAHCTKLDCASDYLGSRDILRWLNSLLESTGHGLALVFCDWLEEQGKCTLADAIRYSDNPALVARHCFKYDNLRQTQSGSYDLGYQTLEDLKYKQEQEQKMFHEVPV